MFYSLDKAINFILIKVEYHLINNINVPKDYKHTKMSQLQTIL